MNAALKYFVEYSKMQDLTPFFIENGYEGVHTSKSKHFKTQQIEHWFEEELGIETISMVLGHNLSH